jgi:protein-tyrosine-phosphatase
MAEGLLRHALNGQSEPLRSIPVYSAGTQAFDGDPASANGVQAMHDAGIDISAHRSRSVTEKLMENAIVVFVMTHQHMDDLRYYYPDSKTPVYRMREFVSNKARSDISLDVHDPYGMGLGDYKECRDSMVEAIPGILTFLKELLSQ